MKPLDSNGGAVEHSPIEDPALAAGTAPGSPDEDELGEEAPRAQSEIVPAPQNGPLVGASSLSRVSQVVPVGTAEDEHAAFDDGEAADRAYGARDDASSAHPDGPRYPQAVALRAALKPELGATLHGPGLGVEDDDEEETTVDAGTALSNEEQDALIRRIQSAMAETRPAGTPPPRQVQLLEPPAPAKVQDARSMFRQTMLLGLPQAKAPQASSPALVAAPSSPPVAAPSSPASAQEPAAVLASVVRVVGPPTQPPPRRSRRAGASPSAESSEPDHEAFVLSQPILPGDPARRVSRVPMSDVPTPRITRDSISRSSIPGVILPPPPQPQDFEPSPPAIPLRPSLPLRASIEPPTALSRTRPPTSRALNGASTASSVEELPTTDPFEGFVAPPPSVAQRWLVVVVVALAVVGLCSLAAIAFGLLGKTGW